MKEAKSSVLRPLFDGGDSYKVEQNIEFLNKSVRVRKSHLKASDLGRGRIEPD